MYKHILLPTDHGDLADKAIEQGLALAKMLGAKVTILTVFEPLRGIVAEGVVIPIPDEARQAVAKKIEFDLKKVAARAEAHKVSCQTVQVEAEQPWRAICEQANERNCDLIIMASHGRRGVSALILGSETQKVLKCGRLLGLTAKDQRRDAAAAVGRHDNQINRVRWLALPQRSRARAVQVGQFAAARLVGFSACGDSFSIELDLFRDGLRLRPGIGITTPSATMPRRISRRFKIVTFAPSIFARAKPCSIALSARSPWSVRQENVFIHRLFPSQHSAVAAKLTKPRGAAVICVKSRQFEALRGQIDW